MISAALWIEKPRIMVIFPLVHTIVSMEHILAVNEMVAYLRM